MSDKHIIQLESRDTVGDRFRMFREAVGKSQEALAKEMKRSVKLVKAIEDGKQMPPIMCMYYIQKNYQLDLNWLLTGAPTLVQPEKFMGGPPPILLKKCCKERGIPVKDQYEELLILLQIPGIAQLILAKLTECKHIFKDEIEDQIKSGKIKLLSG
jgi:transcriptional regulator with XRE-family HTH domain